MDEIQFLLRKVKEIFEGDAGGHDYWHTLRVYRNAMTIAEQEECDKRIVAIGALLHDVDDVKLFATDHYSNAKSIMAELGLDPAAVDEVLTIIDQVSYKGADSVVPTTIEGKIVQDADRIDALGAIGAARAFAYGGSRGRCMHDPDVKPMEHITEVAYRNNVGTTINHFYEKLFRLKDLMNTETGRMIASERDAYLRDFLDKFMAEWDGVKFKTT